ncbi:hypothetical protein EMCRGX_G026718 [Ephydatia muelleri]
MAKPPFAVGNKVVSKIKATYGKEGEILQVSGSSRSRKNTIRWSCGTISTASTKGLYTTPTYLLLPQKRSAYTRKRQAKRPCLGTEEAAEDDGCSSSARRDNVGDESSTDSSNDSDSDSSSSGEDVNAQRIDDHQFDQLYLISTLANRARLLSVASCHASSWLAVIPSRGLNLSLDPDEFQVALKWWLGMDTSSQLRCLYCPDHQLDPLGHHAVTCKGGGDVVLRHNSLRDVFAQFCHRARLGGQLEVGHGYGAESSLSRLADILVPNWMIGKPAAFDLTVVSPLNSTTLNEAGARSGSAARKAEVRKHNANDANSTELGWVCIPLAVETYGCWGVEAQGSISWLAARLALHLQCSKSKAITSIYQRLNLTLVRCNARALLSHARFQHSVGEG